MDNLALIILNYKSVDDTFTCVEQLLSFQEKFHIIVVDNHSPDDSFARISEKYKDIDQVDVVDTGENRGYSAGNNFGIHYAMDRYHVDTIAILNPDVWIPNVNVLRVMLEKLYWDDSFAVIGASVINKDETYNPAYSSWDIPSNRQVISGQFLKSNRYKKARTVPIIAPNLAQVECVAGCFFMAKVSHLEQIGYLDENVFLYNEENILGIRCKRQGYKEVLAVDQFYYHNHKKSKAPLPFRKKVTINKNAYISRKYLCKTYYSKALLPWIWCAEMINRIYLTGCYFYDKIRK